MSCRLQTAFSIVIGLRPFGDGDVWVANLAAVGVDWRGSASEVSRASAASPGLLISGSKVRVLDGPPIKTGASRTPEAPADFRSADPTPSTCKNAARWASRVKKWGNALPHLCPVNSADTSDDHIVDHPGVDAGALHQRGERVGEPVDRMDAGEGAAQSPLDEGVRIASMMPASDLTTSFTGDPRRQLLPHRRWR